MTFLQIAQDIGNLLSTSIPKHWDGRECILNMKFLGNRHWKQMEWIGFYFQFCCEINLVPLIAIPGPKYGRVEFDGFLGTPWDFKAHAMNTSSHKIIVNDSEAISKGIDEFGSVGLILALGKVVYNDEMSFTPKTGQPLKVVNVV